MPAVPDPATLGDIPLFHSLTLEELTRLNGLLHRHMVPAGTHIITVEQPGESAYIILDGTVKVHVEQMDGRDVILAILGPGDVVGEMGVLESCGRSATVSTQEKCTLLWIDRTAFHECLRTMPAMSYNLLEILSSRLRLANERIQALSTLDLYGRVARQTLAFAGRYGKTSPQGEILIPIRLTQGDMADLIGASRERVNRVLVFFKRHRYISVDGNYHITVLNREALASRCQ